MFFFRTKEYLRYKLFSRHRKGHGINSPFIYDVVSRVFRNKIDEAVVSKIEWVRKELERDKRTIMVNDLGTGSVKNNSAQRSRKVSDIARNSSIPEKYGKLLSNLAKQFGGTGVIELGTALGISSMYMAVSCSESKIDTIEGCVETARLAENTIRNAGVGNISVHCGSFDDCLPSLLNRKDSPGLVFIDGNHRKDAVLRYFNIIAENSGYQTVVVLDDIYLTPEMKDAWKTIREHRKVTMTIDIHRMGIVFFRTGINSNHFVVSH
ncbi:MAG TPA: class I SAM-dependent methyltransferase [Bacteroidales bacterium]|nr:class I SAM-dependent methyltransferase [Bacteroidales bacterium]